MEKQMIERDLETDLKKWLFENEIIAIRGPRQCGKTTLLEKIKVMLVEKGVDEEKIFNQTFEDEVEKERFEKDPVEYLEYFVGDSKERFYFLLDEVQYVKNAGKLLKLVYDTLPNAKIFVTGSSTLELTNIGSYLVGRVLFFDLKTFSFSEFLRSKDSKLFGYYEKNKFSKNKKISTSFLDILNKYLEEYVSYGGYPRVVLEENYKKKQTLLKNLFATYVEKDIMKIYGTEYRKKVTDLLGYLASSNGEMINYSELCNFTGLYLQELKRVLKILEDTYVIKIVRPYHRNLTTELKKNPKIYFFDVGLRNYLVDRFSFSKDEKGRLYENFVLNHYSDKKANYWRTTSKAEVDFVFSDSYEKIFPVEVKTAPKITRAFRSFIGSYSPKEAIIANYNVFEDKGFIGKTKVYFVPLCFL